MPASRRSIRIDRINLDSAVNALQALPDKKQDQIALPEAIREIETEIQEVLNKGYSYKEVAALLEEKFETKLSVWSLRRYLPAKRIRKKRAPYTRRKSSKSASPEVTPVGEAVSAPVSPAPASLKLREPEPAPAQKTVTRRSRGTGTAKSTPKAADKPAAKTATTKPTVRRSSTKKTKG